MMFLNVFVSLLCIYLVSGIILPMTKTDGTLDVSSLMSHIALLEQAMENKASSAEVEQLKADLAVSQKELAQAKTKLDITTDELTKLRSDFAASEKELTETKTKLTQVETRLDTTTEKLKNAEMEIVLLKNHFVPSNNTSDVSNLRNDVSHLQTDVFHLKTDIVQLQSLHNKTETPKNVSGATFTRWGRTSCPAESRIIYKGYTGGTLYTDKASSASILCLPDQPIYANHTIKGHDGNGYWGSHIYGTEYSGHNEEGDPFKNLINQDIPCVVCEGTSRSNVIMIPAKNQCFSDWSLEYTGYLMGPYHNSASGEYICVDSDAEALPGGQENKGGQVLFPVEGRCEPLPCPPYHDHWELTCVVCSK